jgi:hypothetical protein
MAGRQGLANAATLGRLQTTHLERYSLRMQFEKIWEEQCGATKRIKRRFGAKSALDYLIGEKLITFADAAEAHPEFAKELPRFLAAVWRIFNEYEIAGYLASRRPATRRKLRKLLYLR